MVVATAGIRCINKSNLKTMNCQQQTRVSLCIYVSNVYFYWNMIEVNQLKI